MAQRGECVGFDLIPLEFGTQPIPGACSARCAMKANHCHPAHATRRGSFDATLGWAPQWFSSDPPREPPYGPCVFPSPRSRVHMLALVAPEHDKLLGGASHGDIAINGSGDVIGEGHRIDQDHEIELQALRLHRRE